MHSRWAAVGAIVLAAVLGACGGGSDGDSAGSSTDNGDVEAAATVELVNLQFQPAEVTIDAGEAVLWEWNDTVQHDVKFDDFRSKIQTKGIFTHTFDVAGTYDYVCTVHPTMKGTVEVT